MKQQLTAKLLNDKIKKGWTDTDFARHLEISTEQFWDLLKKEFTRNAYEGFRTSLHKNGKHQKRLSKNHSSHNEHTSSNIDTEETTQEINCESVILVTSEENLNPTDDVLPAPQEATLEELEIQLSDVCQTLNALELQHKDVVSARHEIRSKLEEHKKGYEEILETIRMRSLAIVELQQQLEESASSMEQLNSQINSVRKNRDSLISQIEKSKKVYIYTCDSGEVEMDTKLSIDMPEWKTTFDNIVIEDELDSLTIKQLKALAKTITLIRFLLIQKIPYEVAFENQTSEAYFKKVIS